MGYVDILIILFLLLFTVVGFKKGIIKEAVSLVGIILVFVISFVFKEQLGNILCKWLPFFNYLNTPIEGMVSLNVLVYQLLSFFLIFSLAYSLYMIILKISGVLQKIVNFTVILLIPSKIGGAIIGFIEGYIFIFIVLILLSLPIAQVNLIGNSNIANKMLYETPILSSYTNEITGSLKDTGELVNKVINKEITTNDANLQIIDTMLKYKLVKPKTIEQLIVLDKLKEVKGLESIVEKYK